MTTEKRKVTALAFSKGRIGTIERALKFYKAHLVAEVPEGDEEALKNWAKDLSGIDALLDIIARRKPTLV